MGLSVSPFEDGDGCGSFPIFGDSRRYETEVEQASNRGCNNDGRFNFRKRGSRFSSPADLCGFRFCSYFRTSIWIWVKEKLGRLGQVAAGGVELLAGVGVARRKAWPAVEKCLLKFSIIVDLSW